MNTDGFVCRDTIPKSGTEFPHCITRFLEDSLLIGRDPMLMIVNPPIFSFITSADTALKSIVFCFLDGGLAPLCSTSANMFFTRSDPDLSELETIIGSETGYPWGT